MTKPPLRSFRTENFKAIRDSGSIEFGWLTAFIGNNGSGKSSLIEAMETFRDVVLDGVDPAFRRWRGFEHVANKAGTRTLLERNGHRPAYTLPLQFHFDWSQDGQRFTGQQAITHGARGNSLFIQQEQLVVRRKDKMARWTRSDAGVADFKNFIRSPLAGRNGWTPSDSGVVPPKLNDGESMLKRFAGETLEHWQFLLLNPENMGQPTPQQRASSDIKLARDGSNVAEYLNEIRNADLAAFHGLLDALRYVLPYADDLQPTATSELERAFYLKLKEAAYEVPGWLLSTSTLRIVALLAALRHPKPPPLLVIEEIENGLDPRTLHLVVEEIRAAITAGKTQVILTTHSPYLLDLLDLSHIVIVEREDGQPIFRRPDAGQLAEWSKSFSPGRLYTMGRLAGSKP